MPNCIRFFPTQAFNFAFKDRIKRAFPKYTETHKKQATNAAAEAAAGAGARHLLPRPRLADISPPWPPQGAWSSSTRWTSPARD